MGLEGWVLAVKPGRGKLELLLSDGERREWCTVDGRFDLYLKPAREELPYSLECHEDCLGIEEESWLLPPWYTGEVAIKRASFATMEGAKEVAKLVRENSLAEFYNTFPDILTQNFFRLGYQPTAKLKVAGGKVLSVLEDPSAVSYETPQYDWAVIRFFDWHGEVSSLPSGKRPLRYSLTFGRGMRELSSHEGDLSWLESHRREVEAVDIIGYPSRMEIFLKDSGIRPGAVPIKVVSGSGAPSFPDELLKLVEWSRVSYMPLSILSDASIGKPLTSCEARVSMQRKCLISDGPPQLENWKSLRELTLHDRGGLLFRPDPGVHFGVAQLDFASMYPTIIASWNISPETVNPPYGIDTIPIPGTSHCVIPPRSRVGIVSEALEGLVGRRRRIQELSASGDEAARVRQAAIKWLLVASFGYLGFRNARFGKIEAYECVTAISRHLMEKAMKVASDMGFRVLHIMVDSLFVVREDGQAGDFGPLSKAIAEATGIGIKMEALYDWVVFTTNRGTTVGSPGRYFGRLTDGTLKVKGLAMVKRNTPPLVRRAQEEALSILERAKSRDEFMTRLPAAEGVFSRWSKMVEDDGLPPESYVFALRGGRSIGLTHEEGGYLYHAPTVHVIKGRRPYPAELGFGGVDRGHYLRLLESALEEIVPPGTHPVKDS